MEVGVERKFGEKIACPAMATFFQIFLCLEEKITHFGYLEGIWRRFGRTRYLVIWLFEQIDKLQRAPIMLCGV